MAKAGVQTSEFWIAMVITLLNTLIQGGILPSDLPYVELGAMLTNGAVVVAYIISRWIVKSAPPE